MSDSWERFCDEAYRARYLARYEVDRVDASLWKGRRPGAAADGSDVRSDLPGARDRAGGDSLYIGGL